jgi:hypothetical protein
MVKRFRLYIAQLIKNLGKWFRTFWRKNWWHKIVVVLVSLFILLVGTMYGIAQWYIHTQRSQPLELGVTFIPGYAGALGLNPQETMDALIDINVKNYRLVSYWDETERVQGQYDFSALDWQFQKAEASGSKVILAVGLRQPRWPECHMPDWARSEPPEQWTPQLMAQMTAVIDRYKDSPSLQSYQLENEYFLKGFGNCEQIAGSMTRERLVDEYNLVKKTDPNHPIIVGRSNNALGFPVGQPQPDEFSVSVYKRVWDAGITHRYLEYPQPAWFYGFLAGTQKIFLGKNMMIAELQAEAWPPNGKFITDISLDEQNKSIDAKRLKARFDYGEGTGMRQINLWGGEYWYYRKQILHDPSLWNVAEEEFQSQK